jgi:uncharacterized protein (DUF58 family)
VCATGPYTSAMVAFSDWPDGACQDLMRARSRAVSGLLRLPLRSQHWRGPAGGWAGTGRGSSLDFQDHRPYLPGDDPRYINWQAYARTGVYTMKLYREEVSPTVDIVLDVSASMRLDAHKLQCMLELYFFAVDCARDAGAALHACLIASRVPQHLLAADIDRMLAEPPHDGGELSLDAVPFRHGSLRVLISDCLFTGSPETLLRPLSAGQGRGVVLAPFTVAEAEPDWEGNLDLVDCETAEHRHQRVDAGVRARYLEAYARHFELWQKHARRHGVRFARVRAEADLRDALREHALPEGAVELWA